MVATFHDVWTGIYQESVSIGSLNYLSMTVGLAIATQFGVRFADKIYQRLRAKNNGQGKAEFRLPILCAIAVVVPIGLFWYGWSARTSIHWIMPYVSQAPTLSKTSNKINSIKMITQRYWRSNPLRRYRFTTRLRPGLPDRYVSGIRGERNGERYGFEEFTGVGVAASCA